MTFRLSSPSFDNDSAIPMRHTCEGEGISPALEWSGAPPATRTFALVVDDPDAPDPDAPQRTFAHWLLYDIPASATDLPEDIAASDLPAGTREGLNDRNRTGWTGPCPPIGRHRYFHKLYALDAELGDLDRPRRQDLLRAIENHVLASVQLVGTYQKRGD